MKYARLEHAKNQTEIIVHFLVFAHSNRPGERIPWDEITRNVLGTERASKVAINSIKRRNRWVQKEVLESYKLGFDSDKDGALLLDNPQEISERIEGPQVRAVNREAKKLKSVADLVEERGGSKAFDNTPEGQKLAKFHNKVVREINSLKLPSNAEIRGLLI